MVVLVGLNVPSGEILVTSATLGSPKKAYPGHRAFHHRRHQREACTTASAQSWPACHSEGVPRKIVGIDLSEKSSLRVTTRNWCVSTCLRISSWIATTSLVDRTVPCDAGTATNEVAERSR